MVVIRELRVTNDGEYLIIDARVRKESIYKDVTLVKVTIGTHKNYTERIATGKVFNVDSSFNEANNNSKQVFMRLKQSDLNGILEENDKDYIDLKKDLIYVYIETTPLNNENCPSLPCDLMQTLTVGVTTYMGNIYNTFMNYMRELSNTTCENKFPQGLIDLILRYTALTTAIDSKHFIKANEFYTKWFTGNNINNSNSNCGCNG